MLRDTALTTSDSGAIYVLNHSGIDAEAAIVGSAIEDVVRPGDTTSTSISTTVRTVQWLRANLVRRAGSDALQIHGNTSIENNLLNLGEGRPAAARFQTAPTDTNPPNVQTGSTVAIAIILSSNSDPELFVWNGGAP